MCKKFLKVYYTYTSSYNSKQVPFIRLSGKWLQEQGFNIGDRIHVRIKRGKILIKVINHANGH
ncbi:MAG: SymE family type I addiction module toxin [Ruminiclostridium sp.]